MSTISVQGLMEGLEEDHETGTLILSRQLSSDSDNSSSFVILTGRRISSSSSGSQAESVDRSIRKIYPKVRTGCDTCKRRKIKCDEGKPFCSRCIKSGRQCDGYHPPQIKLFEPLVRVDRSDSVNEERSFSYYLTETAVRMAGYRPIQLDESFWSKLCPRMASSLPAIRSALVALGATSEKYEAKYLRKESADEVKQRTVFALEQYTKALRQLCASIGNSSISTEATLVCCLLLTSCDFWHTGIPTTLDHSYAGLRICRTVQNSDYCQPPDDKFEVDSFQLFPAFVHLADCATISGDHKDDEKASLVSQFANNTKLVAPLHFSDPHEAFAAMDRTMRQLAKITSSEFPEHVSNLQSYLPGLITALHESMALAKQQDDVMATFGFRSLVVHHHVANIILNMIGNKDEFMYDKYICDFEFIVSEIETLLQLQSMDGKLLIEGVRVWMGFIPPLFFAATKCRDSDIRHRAVKALHLAPHTERMWTTCTAAQVAQQILWLEEAGITSEECINAACGPRINLLNIGFDLAQNKISLAYERQNVRGPKYATSTISWARSDDVDAFYVPNWVEMPPKQVRVAGYAPIIMTFRGIRCHCGESTSAREHSILLKSTMKLIDPQLSDASTITKRSGCSPD